jgi:plastocyanin
LKSKKQLTNIVLAISIIVGTIAVTAITMSMTTKFQAVNAQTTIMVHAGGGNSTNMLAAFVPQQVQISVGQSITWDNPSPVPESHTVKFVLNNKTMTANVPLIYLDFISCIDHGFFTNLLFHHFNRIDYISCYFVCFCCLTIGEIELGR